MHVMFVVFLMAAATVATQPAAAADPALPDTVAGGRVAAFLAAFNSDEEGALERFFEENSNPEESRMTPAQRAVMLRRIHADQSTLSLRRVEKATPGKVVTLVEGTGGHFMRLTFEFGDEEPHYLAGIGFALVDPDEPTDELPPMNLTEALAAVHDAVGQTVADDEFSGTVLVARDGEPVLLEAWGGAVKGQCVANRIDTAYNLGSINKIFTRTAIGQLVVAGKLSLDDSVGKWLPDYPNAEARDKVTVRHLVEMTSGIGDFFGERYDATPKDAFRHNRDYLQTFADLPLEFEPGSDRQYSNGGYIVLGEIIAAASGEDYYEYVRGHIFDPAGMLRTASYEADHPVANLAEGYTRQWDGKLRTEGPRRSNIYSRPARGSSAGGGYSTAEDLLRFVNALVGDTLLPPAWTGWVLGGAEPSGEENDGDFPHDEGGFGFAGGAPGINSMIEADLETRTTIVVMSNYDPPSASRIAQRIRRIFDAVVKEPASP
jgi:CubicO group peptidase (beta-lactamase class C family)